MSDHSKAGSRAVQPEWTSPLRVAPDPIQRRLAVPRVKWSRAIRARPLKLADYAVARALADYGNKDGSSCHPGNDRLATDLSCTDKTIKRSIETLVEQGWITLLNPGVRHRGVANEYQLTVPAETAVALKLWPEGVGCWTTEKGDMGVTLQLRGHEGEVIFFGGEGGHVPSEGGHPCPGKGVAGVPPPGSHQGFNHHADSLTRAHATARERRVIASLIQDLNPFDDNGEELQERIEKHLGHGLDDQAIQRLDGMLGQGRPLAEIVAVAIADPYYS